MSQEQTNNYVFLLGGKDLEMYRIKVKLSRAGLDFLDKDLKWGAKIDDYKKEIEEIMSADKIPLAVELSGSEMVEGVETIDHHGDLASRPASIVQVMNKINRPMLFIDELVAANDSAYIPGMEGKIEEHRERLEKIYGKERFEKLKVKLIDLVRAKDRQMQGVTQEDELEAVKALENKVILDTGAVVVKVSGDKFSPVADRLYPTWPNGRQNLIVVCNENKDNQQIYYFGRGDICKNLKEHFGLNGGVSWGGGVGYGDVSGLGFAGCISKNSKEVIDFITQYQK